MSPRIEVQPWQSEKILPHHLERLAVVYVRQSTMQQVLDHQESTRVQYGLAQRAEAFGWKQERVLTIDDDLGKSGSSVEGRIGFQRLVTEVGLNHVGLILGVEMSRLARSSKDWHQLLEICALFGTLIGDLDGIYDPGQYNDRLLLGLKGTMSEAELHILKQRMVQGKRNKALRGELQFHVPIGYVRRPCGEVQFDPDEQVQQVVKLIFRKFEELGTLNAVLRYLVRHGIQVGVRALSGLNKGDLEWRRPNRPTLQNLLKNPAYAGAYAYGRSQFDPRKRKAGRPYTGQVVTPMQDWLVLIQDHHPAYISWEQYQQNLAQLKANQARADERGAVRSGKGLLPGLLVCHKCGYRMVVQYHRGQQQYRYVCCRKAADYGEELCQYLSGSCLDEYVSEQVLLALEPAAVELSLAAATHLEQERCELDKLWQQRLERAAFEAERAGRHYRLTEPENRLVARQLAQEWEAKLQTRQQLKEDYERFCHEQPKQLSGEQQQSIRQLAENLPTLWYAQTTNQVQRKEIIRQIIQTVTVNVVGESEQVQVCIEWVGGASTSGQIVRPVAKWTQLSNYAQLCQRLEQLVGDGLTTDEITQCLNQEGFHPPKRRKTLYREEVRTLLRRLGLGSKRVVPTQSLPEHEWWLSDLAQVLQMPTVTLYNWVQRGWVKARQCPEPPKHWIIWADEAELARLRTHRQQPPGEVLRQRWRGEIPAITLSPNVTATSLS